MAFGHGMKERHSSCTIPDNR